MSFTVHPLALRDDAAGTATLRALMNVEDAVNSDAYGHTDHSDSPLAWTAKLAGSAYQRGAAWLALPEGVDPGTCPEDAALGYAAVDLPLAEDTDVVRFHVGVRPDARGQGVGGALLDAVEALAAGEGRHILQTWAPSEWLAADDEDLLPAVSGVGGVDRNSVAASWLPRRGYVLEQAQRQSTLVVDRELLVDRLERVSRRVTAALPAAYSTVSWVGPTPGDLLEDLAALCSDMSVSVPDAGVVWEEQCWDAQRLRDADARDEARRMTSAWVVARDESSGALVAYTKLHLDTAAPQSAWQHDTFVRSDHRGRRLGVLVKALNVLQLLQAKPELQRIHTFNAEENRHMLAVNDIVGFRPACAEGTWQKRRAAE